MAEGYYQERQRLAAERLRAALALRMPTTEHELGCEGFFDPWEILPVYGGYDADFDRLAFDVLTDIIDGKVRRNDLPARMFREMLCVADLCEYGSSPRVCFPTVAAKGLFPDWLSKWRTVSSVMWL